MVPALAAVVVDFDASAVLAVRKRGSTASNVQRKETELR